MRIQKIKEWIAKENNKQFEIAICQGNEITLVRRIKDSQMFALGNYQVESSEEIFTITKFNHNLVGVSFSTTLKDKFHSIGTCMINDLIVSPGTSTSNTLPSISFDGGLKRMTDNIIETMKIIQSK